MRSFFEAISVSCVIPAQSPADDERTVFENLSFAVERGEIVDLVGPSGSGKSSLLTACARLNPHAHGAFALDGVGSDEFSAQQWRRDVSYLPQKPILTGKDVAEAIRLPGRSRFAARAARPNSCCPTNASARRWTRWDARTSICARAARPVGRSGRPAWPLARCCSPTRRCCWPMRPDAGLDDDNASKVAAIMADAAARGMAIIRIRHRPPDGRATRTLMLAGTAHRLWRRTRTRCAAPMAKETLRRRSPGLVLALIALGWRRPSSAN